MSVTHIFQVAESNDEYALTVTQQHEDHHCTFVGEVQYAENPESMLAELIMSVSALTTKMTHFLDRLP
jgi:hypothetical protein